jgi:CO/xanthine dehydrogenase Mo-binding subunit
MKARQKMLKEITLNVNGQTHTLTLDPEAPLLYVLRNDLGLKGAKYGCGLEQCGACKVLVDGQAVSSCSLPVENVVGLEVTTLEGLGTPDNLHPLQEAFIEEQAIQCGYCVAGMIVAAQGLLNRVRYPTDDQIREALADNLCRCGVYDRVRRAIKLRVGRPEPALIYEVEDRAFGPEGSVSDDALPSPLRQAPSLDSWIRINSDETITIFSGKVEIGQGLRTAVAQIGAEELDVSLGRVQVIMADTGQTPNEGYTAGSMSLETSGNAVRYAAAEARHILLSLAAEELEAPLDRLTVADGAISDPASGRSTSYWALFGGQKFGAQVTGVVQPKSSGEYTLIGQAAKRLDLPDKVTGRPYYVHDMDLPDMVHGRVVRPPGYKARLRSVDEGAVSHMPGLLKVVRDGSFLGVIAEREEQAVAAMEALRGAAIWEDETDLPAQETLFDYMLSQPDQPLLVVDGTPTDDPVPPIETPPDAAHTVEAAYFRPYHMHASLGPSAAVAHLIEGKLTVWTHSQGVYPLRASMAQALGMPADDIRLIHVEGPGCYGHNGVDDAALDAAFLARALPGRPVSLKWMREDEHAWEPYGSAMAIKMHGSLDPTGTIIDWNQDVYSYTHSGRPRPVDGATNLMPAWHLEQPASKPPAEPGRGNHSGIHRNADPLYALARRRVVKRFLPDSPLRVSSMRGLGSFANLFAIESFMDELAAAGGLDPVEFRLRHLDDARARAVMEAAAEKIGWQSGARPRGEGRGQGIAFGQYKNRQVYTAMAVEASVDRASGNIRLERVVIAADAGQLVNPDGLSNQLEGGFVQAASWTLKEAVQFDSNHITSRDWESYPILAFPDAPKIETVLLNRPGLPFLGAGEGAQGPTPAAIANAVYDAVGLRLRHIPFTPERVRAAFEV